MQISFKGWFGEKLTQFWMWSHLDQKIYRRYHNLIVPTKNGTTQIDHIVLSSYGIFVIETKNINGWIFGNKDAKSWTQVMYGKKYKFQNPLHQNYRHTKAISEYLDIAHYNVQSVVLFTGDKTKFKTELPSNVLTNGISTYIKKFNSCTFSSNEVATFIYKIEKLKDNKISTDTHISSLKNRYASETTCPKCSKKLVERTAKQGPNAGRKFFGCSNFPRCRYTKPLKKNKSLFY